MSESVLRPLRIASTYNHNAIRGSRCQSVLSGGGIAFVIYGAAKQEQGALRGWALSFCFVKLSHDSTTPTDNDVVSSFTLRGFYALCVRCELLFRQLITVCGLRQIENLLGRAYQLVRHRVLSHSYFMFRK